METHDIYPYFSPWCVAHFRVISDEKIHRKLRQDIKDETPKPEEPAEKGAVRSRMDFPKAKKKGHEKPNLLQLL